MIYIPYSSYYESCKVLDDGRLINQATAVLYYLSEMRSGLGILAWNLSTRCDLAALGVYTCAELRRRGMNYSDAERIKAAWFKLRRPGKLRQRPELSEALHQSFQELLVWEAPELYEEKFGLTYSPFKPEVEW